MTQFLHNFTTDKHYRKESLIYASIGILGAIITFGIIWLGSLIGYVF